jgi:CRISPR-associated protein Csm4
MDYAFYKMRFRAATHFGDKRLTDSEISAPADTVFSALCHEALKNYGADGIEKLVRLANEGRLLLSDALPFLDYDFYIPKPISGAKRNDEDDDYGGKKAFKKLKYVPAALLQDYLEGNFDAALELETQRNFGKSDVRAAVSVDDPPRPFYVGTFAFAENAGLYLIVGHDGEGGFAESLLESLAFGGIGGKRSSGLGRFDLERASCDELTDLLVNSAASRKRMTLSASMARPDELEKALAGASYALKRRGGFVSSPDYAERHVKKRDFYSFAAGSCFVNAFEGAVFDVSRGGRHPAYRYAKPLFAGIPS